MSEPKIVLQRARGLAESGDRAGALAQIEDLCQAATASSETLTPAAFLAFQLGAPALAERCLRRGIAMAPKVASGYLNLGNLLRELGRREAALQAYNQARELAPENLPVLNNLAAILEQMARPDDAEAVLTVATRLEPRDAALHDALGRVRFQQANYAGALQAHRQALSLDAHLMSAHFNMGNVLEKGDQLESAVAAYGRAIKLAPQYAPVRNNLALVLRRMNKPERAKAELRMAIKITPNDPLPHINLAELLHDLGDSAAAVTQCREALAQDPTNRGALSLLAITLQQSGDRAAAEKIMDWDRFMRIEEVVAPADYDSLKAFNMALFDQVFEVPSRFSEAGSSDGRQTRNLMAEQTAPDAPLQHYRQLINAAVGRYIDSLDDRPDNPMTINVPKAWDLVAWGTIVRKLPSDETTHIHPSAWLSGVYYTRLPEEVRDDDPDHGGWIEFGRPPNRIRYDFKPLIKHLRPHEGLLVMFPSYFYHRVLPFSAEKYRMSVAFDVMATG